MAAEHTVCNVRHIRLLLFLFLMLLNEGCFIISVFELHFRICCQEGVRKTKGIGTDRTQVFDLC